MQILVSKAKTITTKILSEKKSLLHNHKKLNLFSLDMHLGFQQKKKKKIKRQCVHQFCDTVN